MTSLDGKLYALNAATGQVEPNYPYSTEATEYIRAAPVRIGDLIVIATGSGRVLALDGQRGQVVGAPWTNGTQGSSILTTPVVSGERVYVLLTSGQVQTFTATGGQWTVGWSFTPPAAQ